MNAYHIILLLTLCSSCYMDWVSVEGFNVPEVTPMMAPLFDGLVHERTAVLNQWVISVVGRYAWLLYVICAMPNQVLVNVLLLVIVGYMAEGEEQVRRCRNSNPASARGDIHSVAHFFFGTLNRPTDLRTF